jgi:hypothetical protein
VAQPSVLIATAVADLEGEPDHAVPAGRQAGADAGQAGRGRRREAGGDLVSGQGGQERGVGREPPQQAQAEPVDEQQHDVPGLGQAEHGTLRPVRPGPRARPGEVGQGTGSVRGLHAREPRTAPGGTGQ